MDDYKIIVNKKLKSVYCDNIMESNGRTCKALADKITGRKPLLYDIFPIQLIYNERHIMIAEFIFVVFNRIDGIDGIELLNINTNREAIDNILYEEGVYLTPGRYTISKELALRMYNKFKEVFGCK